MRELTRTRTLQPVAVVVILVLRVSDGFAQPGPLGGELQVNTYTTGRQYPDPQRAISMADDGSFVVVWTGAGQDGSSGAIIGRRFSSAGIALGTEFQVNTYNTGYQFGAAVDHTGDGGFVVVWSSGAANDVRARRFHADGSAVAAAADFRVNTDTRFTTFAPDVAGGPAASFFVAWQDTDDDAPGISARVWSETGEPVGDQFRANSTMEGYQRYPAIAHVGNGNFVVAWDSTVADGDACGIVVRRFGANGAPLADEILVNTYTTGRQFEPDVAANASGELVVTWGELNGRISAQRIGTDGSLVGSEIIVNPGHLTRDRNQSVSVDGSGRFVIAWDDNNGNVGERDVLARAFDASDQPVGDPFEVNSHTVGYQYSPSVAVDGDGAFTVVWASTPEDDGVGQDGDGTGVVARRFHIDGGVTTTTLPTTTTTLAAVCGDATGDGSLTASDALATLQTSVGAGQCPACTCDVNMSGGITASDALLVLRKAIGDPDELACSAC